MSCLLKDAISKIRTKNAEAMVIILGGKAPECVLTLKMLAANHPYFTVKEVLTSAHLVKVQPAILSFVQNSLGERPRSSSIKMYLVLLKKQLAVSEGNRSPKDLRQVVYKDANSNILELR